ncbi:MAG: hypothetical protein B1H11_03305 [Desulfobacteraceae bacterium 4484_190.1]|nr:MAG: hypothetical protein B1H11_03305 [Desulfobacteraceae bacterium 4484_190.1]
MGYSGDIHKKQSIMDSYFYALVRVVDLIYQDEEIGDILHFIVSLATELTGAKGSTIRVLETGTFNLKVVSNYGLSMEYLSSGAIDYGQSVTEIRQGDRIIIDDFENDTRIQNLDAAKKEGVSSVIGIPFTVNETTYSILRVYYRYKKTYTDEEIELLNSLGKLSCLAIMRRVVNGIKKDYEIDRTI